VNDFNYLIRDIDIIAVDDIKSLEVNLNKMKNTGKDLEQNGAIEEFLMEHERIFMDQTMTIKEIML